MQRRLQRLYDLPDLPWVDSFLCSEEVARALVGDATSRGEVLIVEQSPDGAEVGLYLHPDALAPTTSQQRAWAYEGVSHLVYLLFRAMHDQSVSELELEVQAEVDKYVLGLLEGRGMGMIRARSAALRRDLYDHVAYLDAETSAQGERYRKANEAASRYTRELEESFVRLADFRGLSRELRRFYRRGLTQKLERV